MFRKTAFFSLVALCFWGCVEQKATYSTQNLQQVACDWSSKAQWADKVERITVVPFETNDQNVFSDNAMVVLHEGDYYIVDHLVSGRVYRFDSLGNYKNAIGRIGSGPQEYLILTDFLINDQNEILIYSRLNNAKLYYRLDGTFLRKEAISDPFVKAADLHNVQYLYLGYNNTIGQGRLSKYDMQNGALWYGLSSAPKVLMMDEITPVFSRHKDRLFVRETFNDTVLMIENDRIEALYRFDFAPYAISKEFWIQENTDQSTMILLNSDFTTIKRFFENEDYSLVEIQLQKQSIPDPLVGYGLQSKQTQQWTWFFFNQSDDLRRLFSGTIRSLTDQNELLLLVDAESLLEVEDRTIFSNSSVLSTLSPASNTVLVRCTLKP